LKFRCLLKATLKHRVTNGTPLAENLWNASKFYKLVQVMRRAGNLMQEVERGIMEAGSRNHKVGCLCCLLLGLVNNSLSIALVMQRQERLVSWPVGLSCRRIISVSIPSILQKVKKARIIYVTYTECRHSTLRFKEA